MRRQFPVRGAKFGLLERSLLVLTQRWWTGQKIETGMSSLITPYEAAEELGISTKLLLGYVRDGELRYVDVGRGGKRKKRMFNPADVEDFKERRTRREMPCRSTSRRPRHSTT